MKKYFFLMLLILGTISYSCNNEKFGNEYDGSNTNDGLTANVIEGDNNRVEDLTGSDETKKAKSDAKTKDTSTILPIRTVWAQAKTHIRADVNSDKHQQANDVLYDESTQILYISYGTKDNNDDGDETSSVPTSMHGYIDIVAVTPGATATTESKLSILQSVNIPNIDLYRMALDKTNGKLYVAAGADMDAMNSDGTEDNDIYSGAAVLVFNTSDLNTAGATSVSYDLIDAPGYVAKDIVLDKTAGKIAVISGTDGYLVQYNTSDYDMTYNNPVGDGRALGINTNNKAYWLAGDQLNLIGGVTATVTMDAKEGAQRLIDFYKGTYPMVALGANGIGIYNEDLSKITDVPTVKNNFGVGNTDEEANDMVSFVNDSLIAVAEGNNGIMFKYIKDGDITNPDNIINVGGLTTNITGSPNAICAGGDAAGTSSKVDLFVAAGKVGVTYVATSYGSRWNDSSPSDAKDYTPTIEGFQFNQKITNHILPAGSYKGAISSIGHNYAIKSDSVNFFGNLDIREGTLTTYDGGFLINNSKNFADFSGTNGFYMIDSHGEIDSLFVSGNLFLTRSTLEVTGRVDGFKGKIILPGKKKRPDVRLYGSALRLTGSSYSNMDTLQVQKDDDTKKISTLELAGGLTVYKKATFDGGCVLTLSKDNLDVLFKKGLTLLSGSTIQLINPGDTTSGDGGQNTTITVEGTLKAPAGFKIVAKASDKLKIKVGKFEGFDPAIVDENGLPSDAKWSDILVETGL
ncbi:MAG: hypothetical protein ACK5MI_03960 [Mangrovibacterium sp.]